MLLQNPRNSDNISDTFCLNWLGSQPLTWPGDGQCTQEHNGLLVPTPARGSAEHLETPRGPRPHSSVCFFIFSPMHSMVFGASGDLSQGRSKGGHWARRTWGGSSVLSGIGAFVSFYEKCIFLEVNLLKILLKMPWFTFSRQLINMEKNPLYKTAMFWNMPSP